MPLLIIPSPAAHPTPCLVNHPPQSGVPRRHVLHQSHQTAVEVVQVLPVTISIYLGIHRGGDRFLDLLLTTRLEIFVECFHSVQHL